MLRSLRGFISCSRNKGLLSTNNVLRHILQTRIIMGTGGEVVDKLEKRAVEAEETIALLKSQLVFLQKAAG